MNFKLIEIIELKGRNYEIQAPSVFRKALTVLKDGITKITELKLQRRELIELIERQETN